jgi:hypothetical protein
LADALPVEESISHISPHFGEPQRGNGA